MSMIASILIGFILSAPFGSQFVYISESGGARVLLDHRGDSAGREIGQAADTTAITTRRLPTEATLKEPRGLYADAHRSAAAPTLQRELGQADIRRAERRDRRAAHAASSLPSAFHAGTRSATILMQLSNGIASSSPATPHSQPNSISAMNTITGSRARRRPTINGVTSCPSIRCSNMKVPGTPSAASGVSKRAKPTTTSSETVTIGPTNGAKLRTAATP